MEGYAGRRGLARWRGRRQRRARTGADPDVGAMQAVLETSIDAIVSFDHEGTVCEFSPAAEMIFGLTRDEALGTHIGDLVHPGGFDEDRHSSFWRAGAAMLGTRLELTGRHRDGSVFPIVVSMVRIRGSEPPLYTGIMREITERARSHARLEHLALHDGLTGAVGRTLFMERLGRALGGRHRAGKLVAVLFVDLDRFKAVNDSLGHQAGDRLLVEIARRIGSVIRPEDTLARISGDEFTVLCEEIGDESDALAVAARLKAAVEAPVTIKGRELRTGASVGVALARGGYDKPDAVLTDADSAMYRAKQRQNEGRPILFDDELRTAAGERSRLESELRAGIERGELELHYQPQVSLLSGMPVGVEALVRWNHPALGQLPPAEFIPLAEETGLIVPLGERVLEMACLQAGEWSAMRPGEPPMTMSVNLSPAQLLSPTLSRAVEGALERSGMEPCSLCLEITERTLMVDGPTTAAALAALSGMGVRLAIDDFGTGYSSLSYLRLLPVDSLKVDAAFVKGLGRRRDDKAIVAAVIQMAHALGMGVVAEGVESERQVSELRNLGCDLAQGFRFARPTPAGELRDVIEQPRPLAAV